MNVLKKLDLKSVGLLFGPFVVILMVGVALVIWSSEHNLWHGLGSHLLVAGIIGITIEVFAAAVLIRHTAEELSARLVGYGLPESAQQIINDLVHRTKRVYRDYRATFRLTKNGTSETRIKVHVTLTYTVVNNGASSEAYKPKLEEEAIYDPKVLGLEYDAHMCVPDPARDPLTGVVTFDPEVSVSLNPSKPIDALEALRTNQKCVVRWRYTLEMEARYSLVIAFGGVTINPQIILDEVPEGYEFHAGQGGENKCVHVAGGTTWEYRRAYLAGQHLRVWWRPRVK